MPADRRRTVLNHIARGMTVCVLVSCAALRPAPAPEYAAINRPFDPAAYDSIAVELVNSSNQWLPADAQTEARVSVAYQLSERGYAARMRSVVAQSDAPRIRWNRIRWNPDATPPTPVWAPYGAGWAPTGTLANSAARDVATELNLPAVLVIDVLDVRVEMGTDAADSSTCHPQMWRGGVNTPTSTHFPTRCAKYNWSTVPALPGDPMGMRRTGVSVYARLIDRATGEVVWARRVGGWGVGLDEAVTTLITALPSHERQTQ